ncbi:LacI family DNA-binding transcriptional regulator [Actinomadura physcomitrii]|uniref:LacI family DNA-binding transcriptional regulator n=1 Tax=Actinomadura physcomitrii TaxID=2650748 RepID=UPI001369F21A|nr:LacI family DNA-binding transcriptional regulator [Actinomadura physcomitrii]
MPRQAEGRSPVGRPGSRPATSVDVAKLAGVSRATVSHVLNGQVERFNTDTVERVRRAAAALGYVRSAAGRALALGRSDFIVVVVPNVTFIRLQDVVQTLSADIEKLGFTAVVHFSVAGPEGTGTDRLRHLLETLRPAGVLDLGGLTRADREFAAQAGCPVLPPDKPPFNVNEWLGFLQADHLRSRGYARIAYALLADERDDSYARARAASVAAFCAAEGMPPSVDVHVPIEPEGAQRALEALLEAHRPPFGVACYNDKVALALLFAARRLGLAVPDDVGVIGMEGADVGQVVSPRLTTVRSDVRAAMRPFRYALAQAYGGPASREDEPVFGKEAFAVLPGETT